MKAVACSSDVPRRAAAYRTANVAKEPFKQSMERWYSDYAKTYDRDGYHTRIAERLIEKLDVREGDRILDIATGTGLAGFAALRKAGQSGSLVAVDISPEMLEVAARDAESEGLQNAEFVLCDAQNLDLPEESFDDLICSSALVLFPDAEWTLRYWKGFLVSGGRLAVHCFHEKSYVAGKLIQTVAAERGVELVFSEPTGTPERCRRLLENAGYDSIAIDEVTGGEYRTSEKVMSLWDRMIHHPMVQLPTRIPDAADLNAMRERYREMVKGLETEEGIWDEDTIMYVYARKP